MLGSSACVRAVLLASSLAACGGATGGDALEPEAAAPAGVEREQGSADARFREAVSTGHVNCGVACGSASRICEQRERVCRRARGEAASDLDRARCADAEVRCARARREGREVCGCR